MSRETQLAQAFVEAADTLTDEFDIIVFFHAQAERRGRLLDADAANELLTGQPAPAILIGASRP
jgi:hypothetical protein